MSVAARSDATVVWGRALESGAAPAYWPWLNVLRMLRSACPDLTNAALDQLLDVADATPVAQAMSESSRLLDGVLRLVEACSGDRPLVVVLEDVQWADAESLELATHVVSGLTSGSVLVVVTLRDGEEAGADPVLSLLSAASRRGGVRLRLDGLAADDTAALLAQVSGGAVDDAVARLVHERVEGNPFYAIELQRLLDAEGLAEVADVAARAVPVGVRDVVRQRLARLPEPTLGLLEIAAVAGREVDVELISEASGRELDVCLDDLEVALRYRLLAEAASGFELRFSHALVREVVVDQLSALRRARTHLAIADAIVARGRDQEAAEILAEHLWAAVPIGAGNRAAQAMDRASDVAIRRFAVGTARHLLERSLELRRATGSGPDADAAELDTLVRLVWVLWAQGGYGAGLAHYERGAELARRLGRHGVELDMQRAEWASHATSCDLERARPVADRFRSRAEESDDPMIRLAGFTTWGIQCWHDGKLVESAEYLARARDHRSAVAARADDLTVEAEFVLLSILFGLVLTELVGQLEDPESEYEALDAVVHGNVPVAIAWTFAANAATCVGDLGRVERATRRSLEAEAGESLGLFGSQSRMFRGAMLIAVGRADEGRAMFDSGLDHYRGAGIHTALGLALAAAASAEVVAGDIDRAATSLRAPRAGRRRRAPRRCRDRRRGGRRARTRRAHGSRRRRGSPGPCRRSTRRGGRAGGDRLGRHPRAARASGRARPSRAGRC
ncbi:MAG: ATP-binding protein [Microthrixaceae bacterium]